MDAATERALQALAGWTVTLIQFNGLVAAHLGLTDTALQCLYALVHHGPATAGQLARWTNLSTGAASRMIERLQVAGYVRRVPDPADRRRVRVEPVPAALARVGELYDRLNDGLAALVAFLQAAERSTEAEIRRVRSL